MDPSRANPDKILKMIHRDDTSRQRGHLKIFFGYAAGVGKTYAMLKAAHAAKSRGVDVVAGYVEPHVRPETMALLEGLEQIPNRVMAHDQITLREFDLDAAIQRHPQLILVDELAHTNANGCRHAKRYQDVEELLQAGIDVYTTVNVQHIESLNDTVASITGVMVQERIPDFVFDDAYQVELVDLEPEELIERFKAGKIYQKNRAQSALENFFTVENLIALREIALRRCADRINKMAESTHVYGHPDYFTDEHILVCLSSSPSNQKIIRMAARMADAFKASFTALFVETPEFSQMSEEDKARLRANVHLAEQLGAVIETVYGNDIAEQITEYARLSGVSKVVIGRSSARRRFLFSKPSLIEKIIALAPNLDIHIIPDERAARYHKSSSLRRKTKRPVWRDTLYSFLSLAIATAIGFAFYYLGFTEANIITIYILGVLVTAIVTSQRVYSLVSSIISVLVFNYFFTVPRFTFNAYDAGYPVTFVIMFVAAFITSSLAEKLKQHARNSARTAYRTSVLFETNQMLQKADGRKGVIDVTARQLTKLLERDIIFYEAKKGQLQPPRMFAREEENQAYITENEKAVAAWVYKNNKRAGATTDTLGSAKCYYLAVRVNENVYGVVGIVIHKEPLDAFENSMVLSILGECALALENIQAAEEREQAAVLAKNEQLRANLLRSISHDLRTPLTSISGNAGMLMADHGGLCEEKKQALYQDIYQDALWLINLVENLLSVTRIENGTMKLNCTTELLDEVVDEALRHINRKSIEHEIILHPADEILLAKMDARLMVQVVINLVDNAIKYTPVGSKIELSMFKKGHEIILEVADNGKGIPANEREKIFTMFYTVNNTLGDSRRSMGIGLALCKSIVTAHKGRIYVRDNQPSGAVFGIALPAEEVDLDE